MLLANLKVKLMRHILGLLGALWLGAFLYFVYDDPEIHPRISEEELMYLRKSIIRSRQDIICEYNTKSLKQYF